MHHTFILKYVLRIFLSAHTHTLRSHEVLWFLCFAGTLLLTEPPEQNGKNENIPFKVSFNISLKCSQITLNKLFYSVVQLMHLYFLCVQKIKQYFNFVFKNAHKGAVSTKVKLII